MQGHKTVTKAAPSSSGHRSEAGLLFSGWCREGYWRNGELLSARKIGREAHYKARSSTQKVRPKRDTGLSEMQLVGIPVLLEL